MDARKVLVIPDVHLKPWMFDKADEIDKGAYDCIVCLGDLVDDWGKQNDEKLYRVTLEKALDFGTRHTESLWCYGNHDLSYLYCLMESGFSLHMMGTVCEVLDRMEKAFGERLAVIHRVNNWLFSHAGLTEHFIEKHLDMDTDTGLDTEIIPTVNKMAKTRSGMVMHLWTDESPIWHRYQDMGSHISLYDGGGRIFQCTGHTPTKKPRDTGRLFNNADGDEKEKREKPYALSLDTFSTYSSGKPIGDVRFVIVDTINNTWFYAGKG